MKPELLCTWLALPTKAWPPDHYTLLGLKAEDADLPRIERQVQARMAKLRCYQLSHPEEATEGMNRLAQAFISLTEAASKNACPAPAPPRNGAAPPAKAAGKETVRIRPKPTGDTAVLDQTKSDWRLAPPPVRGAPAAKASAAPEVDEQAALIRDLACSSSEARTGLGTLPALIERIDQTRLLLTAWQRLGGYLQQKKDGGDLTRLLATIRDVTDVYPAFVGHPGKPGYRVVALARLAMTFDMLQSMGTAQREDLLRDWDTGHKILLEHRRFLRQQFKSMRQHGTMALAMRAVRTLINDHALLCGAATIALIAACVALRFWLF